METTQLLNAVQGKLIEFANENGVDLKKEFGTVEEFKRFVIAFTIKSLVNAGVDVSEAYDIVMGAGEYNALAERVWEAAQ